MHEMGVVLNIISSAERLAMQHGVSSLGYIIVDVGQLSGVVPAYLTNLWEIGTKDTICEGAELIINETPGRVKCQDCGEEYLLMENVKDNLPCCPKCQKNHFQVLNGAQDVMITELGVPE